MDVVVKEEIMEHGEQIPIKIEKPLQQLQQPPRPLSEPIPVIELSSSDSDYSSDDSDAEANYARVSNGGPSQKKQKLDNLGIVLPAGFLDPLPPEEPLPLPAAPIRHYRNPVAVFNGGSKQFWKAGDYEDSSPLATAAPSSTVGMDHVRVHPKFLHSNATSHKWALGAFAELLDNALDEVFYGATFVNVDMLENKKDGSRMLLIEDNGGGMDPDKMRQCMSLGYSAKSKMANVIGQYGNGFKTSTMRLGADVIVFSRCRGKDGKSSTQSIGMLSYTFLRSTAKEDIVVPMLDYEKVGREWNKLMRSSKGDWDINAETVVQWSPYSSETELLQQFSTMSDQGTRILIYNLWEDDQGELELDFDTDQHDIQIRGVNRDEKKIEMAKQFPNSRHFLTYRNSLRSYAAILYLRLPPRFRIVLRGKDVDHHNIVNDLMLTERITYRPQPGADGVPKDASMVAIVTVGFVKDAKDHIDVQGFNVYHKNRLIKPFWRVWNAAGSDGRGVIGVLEANFVEPAHDKQGFERTTVLSRLESRLVQMQKTYWSTNCHKIGYAPRRQKKLVNEAAARESSPDYSPYQSSRHSKKYTPYQDKYSTLRENPNGNGSILSPNSRDLKHGSGHVYSNGHSERQTGRKYGDKSSSSEKAVSIAEENSDSEMQTIPSKEPPNSSNCKDSPAQTSLPREHSHKDSPAQTSLPREHSHKDSLAQTSLPREHSHNTHSFSQNSGNSEVGRNQASNGVTGRVTRSQLKEAATTCNRGLHDPVSETIGLNQLKVENSELKDRLKKMEESYLRDLEVERDKNKSLEALVNGDSDLDASSQSQLKVENHKLKNSLKKLEDSFLHDLQYERDRCKSLEAQLKESEQKIEEMNKEQEALIDIFSEERSRRDSEEENLRKKLKDASNTIQQLLDKVRQLENLKSQNYKTEGRV